MEVLKEDEKYAALLSYIDSSAGILPVLNKLPHSIHEKWTNNAVNYRKKQNVTFPSFSVFVEFMREISRVRNDQIFQYDGIQPSTEKSPFARTKNVQVMTKKTISRATESSGKTRQTLFIIQNTFRMTAEPLEPNR